MTTRATPVAVSVSTTATGAMVPSMQCRLGDAPAAVVNPAAVAATVVGASIEPFASVVNFDVAVADSVGDVAVPLYTALTSDMTPLADDDVALNDSVDDDEENDDDDDEDDGVNGVCSSLKPA
jgi:hypothetical protein